MFKPSQVADDFFGISPLPDLLALGVYVWNESHVQEIIKTVRNRGFKGSIVLGGPQISYVGKGDLVGLYPRADYFIRGYAEDSFKKLLYHLYTKGDRSLPKGVHKSGTVDLGETSPILFGTVY